MVDLYTISMALQTGLGQLYRVNHGLGNFLSEIGVSLQRFADLSELSKDTALRASQGKGVITETTKLKLGQGMYKSCIQKGLSADAAEEMAGKVKALCQQVPIGEVRINGNEHLRLRLNELAAKHGLERFEYLAMLFEGGRDPLALLAAQQTGSS